MELIEKIKDFDDKTFSEKAHQVYDKIKDELIQEYKGKIVAIEPESGDYFIGDTKMEAGMQAKIKYPDKLFYFFKVGFKGVYKRR
jgi:hypothetical protein